MNKKITKSAKQVNSHSSSTSRSSILSKNKSHSLKLVAFSGLLISLLLLIFSYHYFGSYFEMNDDPRYVMAMKGFASPLPYNNFVSVYKFTVELYIFLYKLFPSIGWYGYSMFLILWGALFNIFISLYFFTFKKINYPIIIFLFIGFYFLVFLQNAYWINFTRPSILATSSFLILLSALYINIDSFKKNKWIIIFPILTYVLAHLTRLDGGYLGFVYGLVFGLILISLHQKKTFHFLKKFILPVFAFIILIKFFDFVSQNQDPRNQDFLKKTELIRQLIDYRNLASYKPQNIKDTIAYNAMINARYCNDNKVISIDFIKSLLNKSSFIESGNEQKFKDEFGGFVKSLNEENIIAKKLNYIFFFLIALWFISSIKKNLKGFLFYVCAQVVFLLVIIGMSFFMKLPARIHNPLLLIITIVNIFLLFKLLVFEKKIYRLSFLAFILVLFSVPSYMKANQTIISNYKKYGKINRSMFDDMNRHFNNTIFIPTDLRSWEMHNATDPIKEINFKQNNCYVYLSIELSLAPETQDQLVHKFGTSDHSILFKKIREMNNVIFISNDNYINFIRAYYHYFYQQDYFFEVVFENENSFSSNTGLKYYRLKK